MHHRFLRQDDRQNCVDRDTDQHHHVECRVVPGKTTLEAIAVGRFIALDADIRQHGVLLHDQDIAVTPYSALPGDVGLR